MTWWFRMTYPIRTQLSKVFMVEGLDRLVTDIWMAAKHCIVINYRVNNIMNRVTRRKLGLTQNDDAKKSADQVLEKLSDVTPISQDTAGKDYTSYSTVNLKTINIGTLRKPIEKLAIYDESIQAYIPIEIKVTDSNPARYYSSVNYVINLNDEVANYSLDLNVDQSNPYDPLFANFDRLYSLEPITVKQSGVISTTVGDKQRFLNITSSNFGKSEIITVNGAADNFVNPTLSLNGTFTPTNEIINGRTRYVNTLVPRPAYINYVSGLSGWILSQVGGAGGGSSAQIPLYFLPGTGLYPEGTGWVRTGIQNVLSGNSPTPKSARQNFEGFFKLATTVQSRDKNRVYARPLGSTGLAVGNTSGVLPSGNSWVTYPHSYGVESYPAYRYPVSLTFGQDFSGIQDLLIISTGRSSKNIVYVSPHSLEQFKGFWSELSSSSRVPKTGIGGRVLSSRPIYRLASGNLISITSKFENFTGLNFAMVSGVGGTGIIKDLYNYGSARLVQTVPLKDTYFYKLYEPVYKKNSIKTGTWDGIIPSGVPFQIEILRTKNSRLVSPLIQVHVHQTFLDITPTGSGNYQFIRPFNYENLAGLGKFEGYANKNSPVSLASANYISELQAKKQAKSKLRGYLWEKGLTVDNHKVRQTVKLFGTKVTPSGVDGESSAKPKYCLPYNNPSDPLSCSYTGVNRGIYGIPTSAGLRLVDQNSTFIPNHVDAEGDVIKFIPVTGN